MTTTFTPAEVFPPGDYIREEIEARGWAQQDLADVLGKPLPAVNELLSGKRAVTAETALLLEQAFGISAATWMRLEATWQVGKLPPVKNDRVAVRAKLHEKAPLREILRRNWIAHGEESDLERSIMTFLEIPSLDFEPAWASAYAARKSVPYDLRSSSEIAWLARARQLARTVETGGPFDPGCKERLMHDLRALASDPADVRHLPALLARHGIRLVVVEKLSRMRVDGACFWLDPGSPVVALSLRFDRIDYFWFTLLHEVAHVFEGSQACDIDRDLFGSDEPGGKPEREHEADRFASASLLDQDHVNDFIARNGPRYSAAKIEAFARGQGVHPGIVIGQLQHAGYLAWTHHRPFLVRVRDFVIESAVSDGWGSLQHRPARRGGLA